MTIVLKIPANVHLLIKENQSVDFETPFFEFKTKKTINISIAKKLFVRPDKIFRYLKKLVGENVEKGEIIAEKKNFLSSKRIVSSNDGIIKEINHDLGEITLEINEKNQQLRLCYFKGKIKKIEKNKIEVELGKKIDIEGKNINEDQGGEVFYLKESDQLTADKINKKIIVCETLKSFNQIKTEALGASGFITLTKVNEPTNLFSCQIKKIEDFKKIFDYQYSYCIVDQPSSKIIFYQSL